MDHFPDEWRRQRLQDLAAHVGGKAALGRMLGYKDGAFVRQMIAGERPITEKTIRAVHEKPALSGWFSATTTAASSRHAEGNVLDGPETKGTYPLISDVIAGNWAELCDHFQPGDAETWLPSTKNLGRCGYMLRVYGKSMENPGGRYSFPDGMILHVNPDLEPMPGQFVIVRRESTKESTFKQYVLIEGKPFLEAINPDWPRELKYLPLQPGDVWCGVVVDASVGSLP